MTFLRQQTSPGGPDVLPALDKWAGCRMFVSECVCACVGMCVCLSDFITVVLVQGLPNANSIK